MTKHLIFDKWYLLDQPWGDGTTILSGSPDPHLGEIVCSNEHASFNPESYRVCNIEMFIGEIMQHIVQIHNKWLDELNRNQLGALSNTEAIVS